MPGSGRPRYKSGTRRATRHHPNVDQCHPTCPQANGRTSRRRLGRRAGAPRHRRHARPSRPLIHPRRPRIDRQLQSPFAARRVPPLRRPHPNAVPAPDPPRTRPPRPRPRRLDQDSAQCHDSRPTRFRANEPGSTRHAAPGSLDLSRRLRRRTLRWPSDRAGPRPSTARQSRAQCRGSGRMAGLATSGELGCAPPRTALTDERQPGEYRVRTEGIAV